MERQPLELEIPAFLEVYERPRPAPPRDQRKLRTALTANERTASKMLVALLTGLYLVGLLAISGIGGLKVVALPLALASLAIEALLLANLNAAGVTERLFYVEEASARPAPSKTRRALVVLAVIAALGPLWVLAIPVDIGMPSPIGHMTMFAFLVGWLALVETQEPHSSPPVRKHAPLAPSKPGYAPQPPPPLQIALYIVLGLVLFVAGTALASSRPSVTWSPTPEVGTFLTQIGDTLQGLEAPSNPADLKDLLILPRWLAASILVSLSIAVNFAVLWKLKVTPYEGPPATTPGNPHDASQPPNRVMVALAAVGLGLGVAMFLIAVR